MKIEKKIFVIILVVGAVFRIISGFSSYGFLVLDDYSHYFKKAYFFYKSGVYDPLSFRNPVLAFYIGCGFKLGSLFGILDKIMLLRIISLSLSLLSLLAVYGTYLYCKNKSESIKETFFILILSACFCLLPFFAAQKLSETFTIPFLMLGVGLWSYQDKNIKLFWYGLMMISFTILIRFQNGIFIATLFILALIDKEKHWQLKYFISVGLGIVILQSMIDIVFQKQYPMMTFINYIKVNLHVGTQHGVMNPFVFILGILGLTFPPLSFFVYKYYKKAFKKHGSLTILIIVFVVMHSLITHKEDRFVFSTFPLMIIIIGSVLADIHQTAPKWMSRIYFYPYLIINAILLIGFSTYNPQRNILLSSYHVAVKSDADIIISNLNANYLDYFTDKRIIYIKNNLLNLDETLMSLPDNYRDKKILIAFYNKSQPGQTFKSEGEHYECSFIRSYGVHFFDSLFHYLNPKHNKRRVPVSIYKCKIIFNRTKDQFSTGCSPNESLI